MANLGQAFDATQHDTEQRDYENLPNGIFEVEIDASELKATNDGTGQRLATTFSVLQPEEFKGRKLFESYNLVNKSPQAQEIGLRQFASLCRSIGETQVEDSEQLHFKAFTVKIGLGKPSTDGKYPARNEVKRYYFPDEGNVPEPEIDGTLPPAAANDNKPVQQTANDNQPAQQQATGTSGPRPWGKK